MRNNLSNFSDHTIEERADTVDFFLYHTTKRRYKK